MNVRFKGELDHHTAKGIGDKIDVEICICRPKSVTLDFEELAFMDSSGLAVIMGRRKSCSAVGAELSLANLHGSIRKVLLLSGIQKYVKIKESIYESK